MIAFPAHPLKCWPSLSGAERVARIEARRALCADFPDESAYLNRALGEYNAKRRVRLRALAYIAAKRGLA